MCISNLAEKMIEDYNQKTYELDREMARFTVAINHAESELGKAFETLTHLHQEHIEERERVIENLKKNGFWHREGV